MRVAILSSAAAGGAGIAARRLYEALTQTASVDVDFIDLQVMADSVDIEICPLGSGTNGIISNTHFTVDRLGEARPYIASILDGYDVINIHWASYLISVMEIYDLARRGKKIVFSLHDFYYLTGGCHYPAGCQSYRARCSSCPQVDTRVMSHVAVLNAQRAKQSIFDFPNVHLAAPSAWLRDQAVGCGMVPSARAHVLRNAYDPIDEGLASADGPCSVLLIADSLVERRKATGLAIEAYKAAVAALPRETPPPSLHIVGQVDPSLEGQMASIGATVVLHGHIDQHETLVRVIQQCSAVLLPSYEDNWPNVLVEAACYGCMAIVGPGHGCEEFVRQAGIGFVAKGYGVDDLADELANLFSLTRSEREAGSRQLSAWARQEHAPAAVSTSYRRVFDILLGHGASDDAKIRGTAPDPSNRGPDVDVSHRDVFLGLAALLSDARSAPAAVRLSEQRSGAGAEGSEDATIFAETPAQRRVWRELAMKLAVRPVLTEPYGMARYTLSVRASTDAGEKR